MSPGRVLTEADPSTSGIVSPVRCEYTLKGRHEVNISAVVNLLRLRLQLFRTRDEADRLGPADSSTSNLNSALKRILRLAVHVVAHSSQQAMIRLHGLETSVLQQEASGTISVLDLTFTQRVTQAGGLLITDDA